MSKSKIERILTLLAAREERGGRGLSNGDISRRALWIVVAAGLLAVILARVAASEIAACGVTVMVLGSVIALVAFGIEFGWDRMDRSFFIFPELIVGAALATAAYYAFCMALPDMWATVAAFLVIVIMFAVYWRFTWRKGERDEGEA